MVGQWDPGWSTRFSTNIFSTLDYSASSHSIIDTETPEKSFQKQKVISTPYHNVFVLTWIHSLFSSSVLLKQKKNTENINITFSVFSLNPIVDILIA